MCFYNHQKRIKIQIMWFLGLWHILHPTTLNKQDIHRKKSLFHQQLIGLQPLLVHGDSQLQSIFTAYPSQCCLLTNLFSQICLSHSKHNSKQRMGYRVNFVWFCSFVFSFSFCCWFLVCIFLTESHLSNEPFLIFIITLCNCQFYITFFKYKVVSQ